MHDALNVLRSLPDDLLDRHWELNASETNIFTAAASRGQEVVYMRPFERKLDHPKASPLVQRNGRFHFRVPVAITGPPPWDDIRDMAIVMMRAIDAREPELRKS
jgi:hypothetical protein